MQIKRPRKRRKVRLEPDEMIRYMMAAANRSPRRAWTFIFKLSLGGRCEELARIRLGMGPPSVDRVVVLVGGAVRAGAELAQAR